MGDKIFQAIKMNNNGRDKGGNPQRTPKSRSRKIPSLEGEFRIVDLDHLSFPSIICKNHGRIEEIGSSIGLRMEVKNILKNLRKE
jgi:hypothetical protein